MVHIEKKRLFFGIEVKAPWPETLFAGRILEEKNRHLTFAFLGLVTKEESDRLLLHLKKEFFSPSFKVGFVGKFDQCLFLPPKNPHVVAWHLEFLEESAPFLHYHDTFCDWLFHLGFHPDRRHNFTPHVTLARGPFNIKEWRKGFKPLPCTLTSLHLFESLGHSNYESLFSYPLLDPFEPIEHTGDVAFLVRGRNFNELYAHAKVALCFLFPPLLNYLGDNPTFASLNEVIIALNQIVTAADTELGVPFKAVSFHSALKEGEILEWEMIIDV